MTADFDLLDAAFVNDPFPLLASLRRDSPVHHDPRTGLWLVSRHADVQQVLLDTETYHPDNAQNPVVRLAVPALRVLARAGFVLPPALANNAGPDHLSLRRLVSRFMSAERVRAAVPIVEEESRDLLGEVSARLASEGVCDLVAGYSRPLACRVMMRLFGVVGATPLELLSWSDAALQLFYGRPAPDAQPELAEQVAHFYRWLTDRLDCDMPRTGLMRALADHQLADGRPLDVPTAVAVCFFVLVAGQVTTSQLIATVLKIVSPNAAAWKRAGREEGFAAACVDEVLRREPPVTTWRRITARPVELAGVRLLELACC